MPGSRAPSAQSAMAAVGGPGAVGRCHLFGLLLLLLIGGPVLGWNNPGECCSHSPLPAALSLLSRGFAGDHFRLPPLELFCSNSSFSSPFLFICEPPGAFGLPRSPTGEWGLLGSGRGETASYSNISFLPSLDFQNLSTFSVLGLQPLCRSRAGKLETHLRISLCFHECLMSLTVFMTACCYGWQLP